MKKLAVLLLIAIVICSLSTAFAYQPPEPFKSITLELNRDFINEVFREGEDWNYNFDDRGFGVYHFLNGFQDYSSDWICEQEVMLIKPTQAEMEQNNIYIYGPSWLNGSSYASLTGKSTIVDTKHHYGIAFLLDPNQSKGTITKKTKINVPGAKSVYMEPYTDGSSKVVVIIDLGCLGPETGDESMPMLYACLIAASLIGGFILLRRRKIA